MPMMTVTGAAHIFGPLGPLNIPARLSFDCWLTHQARRAGCIFKEVGPIFM